jgi:succinyl-diaminopimelate desuccinylase
MGREMNPDAGRSDSLVGLTTELMAIPSVSGEEGQLATWLERRLAEVPGESIRLGNNVVHLAPRTGDRPLVVLAGHLDTVAPQGNEEPRLDGDRLFGLGSSDMKSGIAVMLSLASEEMLSSARFDLAWVLYECEEIVFERNGLRRLWSQIDWLADAELAMLLEPTGCGIELGCMGSVHAEFTAPGRAAHSARPWLGENAIYRALPFLTRLAGREPEPVETGGVTFRETVQVTQAHAGSGRNVVPPSFTFNVNFRYAPVRTPEEAVAEVKSWTPEGFQVEILDVAPPAPPRSQHPLIDEFIRVSGGQTRAKQAWTDVAQFAARGIAAFNYGPGIPELAHRADEFVPIANLDLARETLRRFLSGEIPKGRRV